MDRISGKATAVLLVLVMVATPLSPLVPLAGADLSDPGSLSSHVPVSINGNAGFTTSTAVVAGGGSQSDPYIIENWTIDAQTADGIRIQNTDAHFIIRNCRIWNGSTGAATNEGIYLNNVVNGTVQDSRIEHNQYAVYITASENITIYNNSLNQSALTGLFITGTTNATVDTNEVFDNGQDGVAIAGTSDLINVTDNDIHNNTRHGIYIYGGSRDSLVGGNDVHDNTQHGIYLYGSRYNDIFDNTVTNNSRTVTTATFGIYLRDSEHIEMGNNEMFDNRYNLGIMGQDKTDHNHTVHSNNTVDGKPVYYYVDNSSKTVPNDAGFIGLVGCTNMTASSVSMSNNQHGVLMYGTDDSTVTSAQVDGTVHGIYIFESNNNTIGSSTLTNMTYAVHMRGITDDITVNDSTINDIDYAIYRLYDPADGFIYTTTLRSSLVFNIGQDAVNIREAHYTVIRNNTIRDGSGNGIRTRDSDHLDIRGNDIHDMAMDGLNLSGTSSDTEVQANTIHHVGQDGISLDDTNDTYMHDNVLHNNTGHGLHLRGSDRNDLIDSIMEHNDRALFLDGSTNNIFHSNVVRDNTYGVYMSSSDNNRIYNNILNNTNNAFTSGGSGNRWNTSKTAGYNIATGPYLGGNLWSDYTGTDSDGDWLGDTLVPHGPGDNLPLLVPPDLYKPGIKDDTVGQPTTGDQFAIVANAWDNAAVANVSVEYWFDSGGHSNMTMALTSGDGRNGTYRYNVDVPSNATWMHYLLSTNDTVGNLNATTNMSRAVVDDDLPALSDNTTGSPTTGDVFTINISVTDNVNVSGVFVEYWFDSGQPTNASVELTGDPYLEDIDVPEDALVLHYNLSVSDNSTNWATLAQVDILVIDNDLPAIDDLSGIPTTGDPFLIRANITDNLALDTVMVEHWFDDGAHDNSTMSFDLVHMKNVTVPSDARIIHYIISANDTTGNLMVRPQVDLQVQDNDLPAMVDMTGIPYSGKVLRLEVQATDNIGIAAVEVEHWSDSGPHTVKQMVLNGTYMLDLPVSLVARTVSYTVRARDAAGNQVQLSGSQTVVDTIRPTIEDLAGGPSTGDAFELALGLSDNWGVSEAYLEYWYDDGIPMNVSYTAPITVTIPSNALKLRYIASAKDASGNIMVMAVEKDVTDNDRPTIEDTTGYPTTGDDLPLEMTYEDNIGVRDAFLEYWFDRGPRANVSYHGLYVVQVPATALELGYRLVVIDTSGNLVQHVRSINIVDNDPPVMTDLTHGAETGERLTFSVNVTDNTMVQEVTIDYTIDGGTPRSFAMAMVAGEYEYSFKVPVDARSIGYIIRAVDLYENLVTLEATTAVVDIIPPSVTDHSQTATTGEDLVLDFTVTDNIGVVSTKLEYWFDEDPVHTKVDYRTSMTVHVPDHSTALHYMVWTEDGAGNIDNITVHTGVMDNDPPVVEDLTKGTPSANGRFTVRARASDNIGVAKVTVEYRPSGASLRTVTMELKGDVYTAQIPVDNVEEMVYRIRCIDSTGNSAHTDERTMAVSGYLAQSTLYGILAVVLIAVVMVLAVLALRRSRQKEKERLLAIQERRAAKEAARLEALKRKEEEAEEVEEGEDEEDQADDEDKADLDMVPTTVISPRPTGTKGQGLWERREDDEKDPLDEILEADEEELGSSVKLCPSCERMINIDYSFCPHCAHDFEDD